MKVQVDITVKDADEAVLALEDVADLVADGLSRGHVYAAGRAVGRFEILEAQEQAA